MSVIVVCQVPLVKARHLDIYPWLLYFARSFVLLGCYRLTCSLCLFNGRTLKLCFFCSSHEWKYLSLAHKTVSFRRTAMQKYNIEWLFPVLQAKRGKEKLHCLHWLPHWTDLWCLVRPRCYRIMWRVNHAIHTVYLCNLKQLYFQFKMMDCCLSFNWPFLVHINSKHSEEQLKMSEHHFRLFIFMFSAFVGLKASCQDSYTHGIK